MFTSHDSYSEDETKSSNSSPILNEIDYNISFDNTNHYENTINDKYMRFSGKDKSYWQRRRKNNAAAKRSRERRRQHDKQLEQEIQNLNLLNSLLQDEILKLQKQIIVYESNLLNIPQIFAQNLSYATSLSDTISSSNSKETHPSSTESNKTICQNDITNTTNIQNPIDLSCKLFDTHSMHGAVNKVQSKAIQSSNNHVIQDQKYWDRRRRNNEAVRKCRQNKRLKIINNLKVGKEDKEQIKIKIESISSELEKLKSHIIDNEKVSEIKKNDTLVSDCGNQRRFNTKLLKWKSKLIEADQADKYA